MKKILGAIFASILVLALAVSAAISSAGNGNDGLMGADDTDEAPVAADPELDRRRQRRADSRHRRECPLFRREEAHREAHGSGAQGLRRAHDLLSRKVRSEDVDRAAGRRDRERRDLQPEGVELVG